jgi:hypothetical protein
VLTALRLVDGDQALELNPANGYHRGQLEIGLPAVRAVTSGRPGRDGEDDSTSLFGAAAVTLQMTLVPAAGRTLTSMLDALGRYCRPSARPHLEYERDGVQRRVLLRADQRSAPLTDPTHQQVQLSWRAPDGVSEATAEQLGVAEAVPDAEAGRSYDRSYPLDYGEAAPAGLVTVVNDGNVAVAPLLRLYGPCTDPRVESTTTDERLVFTGLVIAAGDWLEIDCRENTVLLNGLADQSRYSRLDFVVSDFLRLLPGANSVRYYPVSFDTGARLEVRFRSAWI